MRVKRVPDLKKYIQRQNHDGFCSLDYQKGDLNRVSFFSCGKYIPAASAQRKIGISYTDSVV